MAKRELKTKKTEEVIETVENVEPAVEEPVESISTSNIGIVFNCSKLNIRKKPNLKADPIAVIDANTEVSIIDYMPDKDWFKVEVNGVIGYCMDKYITITL